MKEIVARVHILRKWGKDLLADEKKRVNLLVCLGLAGLLLLSLSAWIPESKDEPVQVQTGEQQISPDYARLLEERLQTLIAEVEGVGEVRVMVTLQGGQENVYATDVETTADGMKTESHVLLSDEGLVETTRAPQVLGVAVVCEGGGTATVQNRVSTLVEALTGVGANHITVAPMAPTN